MRFPLLRTLLAPQTSVSREGQRGERNSCLQVPPKPGQVVKKPLVKVWVMLRSIPASVCSSLTLWDSRALLHSVLIVPFIIMLHQLTTFKQPKEKKKCSTWHRAVPAMQLSNICPVQQKIQCSTSRATHSPPHPP